MTTTTIKIGGMHCDGCAERVQRVLERVSGVREARVAFATGEASVRYDEQTTTTDELRRAVVRAGFVAT